MNVLLPSDIVVNVNGGAPVTRLQARKLAPKPTAAKKDTAAKTAAAKKATAKKDAAKKVTPKKVTAKKVTAKPTAAKKRTLKKKVVIPKYKVTPLPISKQEKKTVDIPVPTIDSKSRIVPKVSSYLNNTQGIKNEIISYLRNNTARDGEQVMFNVYNKIKLLDHMNIDKHLVKIVDYLNSDKCKKDIVNASLDKVSRPLTKGEQERLNTAKKIMTKLATSPSYYHIDQFLPTYFKPGYKMQKTSEDKEDKEDKQENKLPKMIEKKTTYTSFLLPKPNDPNSYGEKIVLKNTEYLQGNSFLEGVHDVNNSLNSIVYSIENPGKLKPKFNETTKITEIKKI